MRRAARSTSLRTNVPWQRTVSWVRLEQRVLAQPTPIPTHRSDPSGGLVESDSNADDPLFVGPNEERLRNRSAVRPPDLRGSRCGGTMEVLDSASRGPERKE